MTVHLPLQPRQQLTHPTVPPQAASAVGAHPSSLSSLRRTLGECSQVSQEAPETTDGHPPLHV